MSCILAAILAAGLAVYGAPAAKAQDSPGIGGLLRNLLRGGRPEPREREKPPETVRRTTRTPAAAPQPTEPPPPDKLENARVLLVIGDFMASGLSAGLEEAFQQSPGIRVVNASNGSSGLVRDDFYDWQSEIGPLLDENKPSAVAVMIGANDRQQMDLGSSREPVRSDGWVKEYRSRASALATAVASRDIPLVWVGMVPFRSPRVSSDILAFNDIYRTATISVNGAFIDVWDGFVDENGAFVTSGPDINGQTTRLRTGDGTVLSKAGKRLVAFFAEKPLRKIFGNAAEPDIGELGPENLPPLTLDPFSTPAGIERTPPIALTDPDLDGGDELLGAGGRNIPLAPRSPAERLSIEGIAPAPPQGRADDFRLRRGPSTRSEPESGQDVTTAIR